VEIEMNRNIVSLWGAFTKEASFDDLDDVLKFVADKYNMEEEEVKELVQVSGIALAEYFDISKLTKKPGILKKGTDMHVYNAISSIFINGVFFGMFLSEFLKWNFHKK
jgi:hypothetical protein